MFAVSMLGRLSISLDDRRIALTFGPRGRLLTSYLLEFPGRVHRRERLSDMFWEDRPPRQARAAMNTALWRLRKLLAMDPDGDRGACLHSTSTEVFFERIPSVVIDTHVFDDAVRDALAGAAGREREVRAAVLEQAAARYGGSFIEGDGDEKDWVIAERERLHSLYARCLIELMRTHTAQTDYESAISAARRLLATDPFRESVMRALAILLFLNGQRARAIEELARWQIALDAHVGVAPLPETQSLLCALRSGTICADIERWKRSHLGSTIAIVAAA